MVSSKFFALSLLLVSSFALARVQLNTHMQVNSVLNDCMRNRSITAEVQLDLHESAVVYDAHDIRVEAVLLAENDESVHVRYIVSVKNADNVFEIVSAPELHAEYEQQAILTIGQSEQDGSADSLIMTVRATKA